MDFLHMDTIPLGKYKDTGGDDLPINFQITLVPESPRDSALIALINDSIAGKRSKLKISIVSNTADVLSLKFEEVSL